MLVSSHTAYASPGLQCHRSTLGLSSPIATACTVSAHCSGCATAMHSCMSAAATIRCASCTHLFPVAAVSQLRKRHGAAARCTMISALLCTAVPSVSITILRSELPFNCSESLQHPLQTCHDGAQCRILRGCSDWGHSGPACTRSNNTHSAGPTRKPNNNSMVYYTDESPGMKIPPVRFACGVGERLQTRVPP